MKKTRSFAILFTAFALSISSYGQDFSNKGKDFWVGYGYHQVMTSNNLQDMVLYFATDAVTTVTVEIPLLNYKRTYTAIAANTIFESEPLPKSGFEDARLLTEGVSKNGIHITSNNPIVAYAHIFNQSVSGATLLFPTSTLGKEYYSVNFDQVSNVNNANCWVYAVAVDTGITMVEVIPSAPTLTHAANDPFLVPLEQGQVLNLMGRLNGNSGGVFTGVDLTGTKIRSVTSSTGSCKRIAVFSGSGRIAVSCNNTAPSSDNYIVQAVPKNAWGKKYLTVPTKVLPNNYYRICVLNPATIVTVNGVPLTGLIGGFYYQISTMEPSVIEANEPIMVAQIMTSQGQCGNGTPGDPEVIYLSPVEQNINKVIFNSTSRYLITQHWINVTIKTSAVAGFKLDGIAPNAGTFFNHPQESGYMYAQINVGAGQHTLSADSGFNAIAYGLGNAESYGYNAGTNVKDLYQFVSVQNQFATVNFPASCVNTPFFFSMTFPYQPTEIKWLFNGLFPDVTVNTPVHDSTWTINGKQLFRYRLPNTYSTSSTGTFPIKVIAQNPNTDGCGNEQEIDYDLQIFAQPTAAFNFLTNGCVSSPVAFTDASTPGGRPVIRWNWDFGDATTSAVQNPTHLYPVAGSYPAKLSIITDIGCVSNTAQNIINLTQSPTALFSAAGVFCPGNGVTFTNQSTSPVAPIAKWFWNFGDGSPIVTAATGTAQTHNYTTPGSYTVTLQVETDNGCKSGVYSKVIVVDPKPAASFTFGTGCLPNASIQFTDASTINGSPGAFTYLWDFGDGSTSSVRNPLHVYSSGGPFNVKLRVTSAGGCIDSAVRSVGTIAAQPLASFTVSRPESCLGEVVTFTGNNSTAPGSTVTGWLWTFDDGTTQTSPVITKTFATAGLHSFTLKVTSASGCESVPAQGNVMVNPLPVARFTLGSPSCEGKEIIFNDASVAGSGTITKWTWNMGDGSAPILRTPPFTYRYANTGSYKVVLFTETDKGCVSANYDSTITVSSTPVAKFSLPENCVNDPVSLFLDSSSVANGLISDWLWNFGDPNATPTNPNTSAAQNGSHHYVQARDYDVTLTATSDKGCVGVATKTFTINGSVPQSNFSVVGGTTSCVNKSISIMTNPGVDVGRIIKLEVFWDDANDQSNKIVDDEPSAGKQYTVNYPSFSSPVSKIYTIRVRAYSGERCFDDSVIAITVNATPEIQFTAPLAVCSDSAAFQLNASVGNVAGTGVYSGRGVSASGMFNPAQAGFGQHTIKYTFTSATGCLEVREQAIKVNAIPFVDAGPSVPLGVLEGGSVTFPSTATGSGLKYLWTPSVWLSNPNLLQPIASPLRDTVYTLTVINADGCKAADQVQVRVLKGITIPNVFTPNGDGINDSWEITYLESYRDAVIQLYNRYGQLIFQSKGYNKPWDGTVNGKPVPFGTYYYVIDPKNGRKAITGFVDIIR